MTEVLASNSPPPGLLVDSSADGGGIPMPAEPPKAGTPRSATSPNLRASFAEARPAVRGSTPRPTP